MTDSNSLYADESFGILRDITIAEAVEYLHSWIDKQAARAEQGYVDSLSTLRFLDQLVDRDIRDRIKKEVCK